MKLKGIPMAMKKNLAVESTAVQIVELLKRLPPDDRERALRQVYKEICSICGTTLEPPKSCSCWDDD